MLAKDYQRFHVERPDHLGQQHWDSVAIELQRLARSIDAGDDAQALADLKCLVECVALVTLDIAGTPARQPVSLPNVVSTAHQLLVCQPAAELADQSEFGKLAMQAKKMAGQLAEIRNEYGAGHGRARQPGLRDEMVDLALDGALIWVRWALRRIGYFSLGRPEPLIADLASRTFYSGDLRDRLVAANLAGLAPVHQRALGVAVGRRAGRDTFVVYNDGVAPCVRSGELGRWPRDYRIGVVRGYWFDDLDRPKLTIGRLRDGLHILDPIPSLDPDLGELVDQVVAVDPVEPFTQLIDGWNEGFEAMRTVEALASARPHHEAPHWARLVARLDPGPF